MYEDNSTAQGVTLVVKNNEQLDKETEERQLYEPVILELASYVRRCWTAARDAKRDITTAMQAAYRQRKGEYPSEKLAAIQKQGGTDIFMRLTEEKCVACEAWIFDMILNQQEKPWSVKPTPVPEIPFTLKRQIQQELYQRLAMDMQAGYIDQKMFMELVESVEYQTLEEARKKAKKEAIEIEAEIEDDLVEGGFYKAVKEALYDLTTDKNMFIKSPVVRMKKKLVWGIDTITGMEKLDVEDVIVVEFERVSPMNIYPAPSSTRIGDSYLFEHHELLRADLYDLIGVSGFNEDAIREVLQTHADGGYQNWLADVEQDNIENRKDLGYHDTDPNKKIDALQYWGSVAGQKLIEWGMSEDEIPDPDDEYSVDLWLIGNTVIKAALNPDKLGRPPYSTTSFRNVPGSFWGESLCDVLKDTQDACNAAARNLINNMGIASGPQIGVDVDAMPEGEDVTSIFPWKIWQFSKPQSTPMWFFQPESMVNELLKIYEFFSSEADTKSGIPKYSYGSGDTGGALSTATGYTMMFNNATRGIKAVVGNIDDDVIEDAINRHYEWRMTYMPFDNYSGDAKIVAEGSTSLMAKEQQQVRRQELLSILANPVFQPMIKPEGMVELLRGIIAGADLDVDDILPTKEEMIRESAIKAEQEKKRQELLVRMQELGVSGAGGNNPDVESMPVNGAGNSVNGQEVSLV